MPKKTAEITMTPYGKWSPTADDARGLALEDRQAWLVVPIMITRDTEDLITMSNWHTILKSLKAIDPKGDDHEIHRFGHWGPGWFEIILVRPDSKCATEAQECADAIESYPILDDDDHSEREWAAEQEAWAALRVKDRVALLKRAGYRGSVLAARRDYPPNDDNGAIRETLLGY